MAKTVPDSRTPRRFRAISTRTAIEATQASCPSMIGSSDLALWTPEEMETATVST
jgi:hypothetical protein